MAETSAPQATTREIKKTDLRKCVKHGKAGPYMQTGRCRHQSRKLSTKEGSAEQDTMAKLLPIESFLPILEIAARPGFIV